MPDIHAWKSRWVAALSGMMDEAEAEANFRFYSQWLSDQQLEFAEDSFGETLERLKNHEPIQYILGEAWFYGKPFYVDSHTLIPRPETEELCDLILKQLPDLTMSIVDVGTGSGCIPVTLLQHRPNWQATALDIDAGALAVAKINAEKHGVSNRLQLIQHDFLAALPTVSANLIVSNPPYIHSSEAAAMDHNVLAFEPHAALFPEGSDVLIFYRQLAALLDTQTQNCALWAEINPRHAGETLELFHKFRKHQLHMDMSGKWRFLEVVK